MFYDIARDVLEKAVKYLSIGCLNFVRAYDPDIVVFGGGLANYMLPLVHAELSSIQWDLHNDTAQIPLRLAACVEPGVNGAAHMCIATLKSFNLQSKF